jgi:succinate dehydrogenase hydrophobic anchor subunit
MFYLVHTLSVLSILLGLFNGFLFLQGIRDRFSPMALKRHIIILNGFCFVVCTILGLCFFFGRF